MALVRDIKANTVAPLSKSASVMPVGPESNARTENSNNTAEIRLSTGWTLRKLNQAYRRTIEATMTKRKNRENFN